MPLADKELPSELSPTHLIGDKVRVRAGEHARSRARIEGVQEERLKLRLESGTTILMPVDDVTNYSLAARKAWKSMPKRAGRPRTNEQTKRMISIRVESEVWDGLGEAVRMG